MTPVGINEEMRDIVNNINLEDVTEDIMGGATPAEIGIIAASAINMHLRMILDGNLTYAEVMEALEVMLAYNEIAARTYPEESYAPATERMKKMNNLVDFMFGS